MLHTLIWFLVFWLILILSVPFLFVYLLLIALRLRFLSDRLLDGVVRSWARLVIASAGIRVRVSGRQNLPSGTGMLFVCNHQGAFDIPLVLGYIPGMKGFISKKENLWVPVMNAWMKAMHCLFMDRRNPRQSAQVIARGVEYLKQGFSLVVFPEGKRSRDGALRPFKPGSFKLAIRAGVPIVPITVEGTGRLFEGNGGRIRSGRVFLHIHPPLAPEAWSGVNTEQICERVEKTIASRLQPGARSTE
jgi:1-acyl-sn-glycerol-3-phosphate acyltransferase